MTATEHRWPRTPAAALRMDEPARPPLLSVAVSPDGGGPVVHLTGEVDLHTRHLLLEALDEVDGDAPVVIDVSEVTFMDSAGMHVLFETRRHAPVTIRGARPFLRRLFQLSGLEELFRFEDEPTTPEGRPST